MEDGKLHGTTAADGPAVVPAPSSPSSITPSIQAPDIPSHYESQATPQAQDTVYNNAISEVPPPRDIESSSPNSPLLTTLVVPSLMSSNPITDVYLVDASGKPARSRTSNPFLTVPHLHGPQGENARFLAIVDNGAMVNAIDTAAYQ